MLDRGVALLVESKTEVGVVNCFYSEALPSFDDRAITIQELGIDPMRPSRPVC